MLIDINRTLPCKQVPIIIPYVVLIISIYLVVGPIIDTPQIEYMYALLFILAGLIFYVPFVKLGMTPRFMGKSNVLHTNTFYLRPPTIHLITLFIEKVTLFLQLLLEVVPTSTMGMYD